MERRQNNGSVKPVSPRHCPGTCALRNCCFNCCAWTESQRQCPLHCCRRTTWTTQSKGSPTFSAQLHLPTHDLFWTNLRVQLHLPPLRSLDLLILPGTLPATQSSIFIFISSSSTGELCSQPLRGNVRRIGRMIPEHVERI